MDQFVAGVLFREIVRQGRGAQRAIDRANRAQDNDDFFDHIADFLNHAAVMSKILTGRGKDRDHPTRVRGRYLRGVLDVADNDPALDRRLRDFLEHIDERIDKWAGEVINSVDSNIGPIGSISVPGTTPLREFDPTTKRYLLLGEAFDVQAIASSCARIAAAAGSAEIEAKKATKSDPIFLGRLAASLNRAQGVAFPVYVRGRRHGARG